MIEVVFEGDIGKLVGWVDFIWGVYVGFGVVVCGVLFVEVEWCGYFYGFLWVEGVG